MNVHIARVGHVNPNMADVLQAIIARMQKGREASDGLSEVNVDLVVERFHSQ